MTDWHVHIGQFNDVYYDYHDVFAALKNNDVDEIYLAYLTPIIKKEDVSLQFYESVVHELKVVKRYAKKIQLKVNFLYWADPLVLKQLALEKIYDDFRYSGIALHPVLHNWTGEFTKELSDIFSFARKKSVQLFIHTGVSKNDEPLQFDKWFSEYPEVKIRLAHCKDSEPIIQLFQKYPNFSGDTAFCPTDSYDDICKAGFAERMFFGTDFPISHWYEHRNEKDKKYNVQQLTENYKKIIQITPPNQSP